MRPSSRETLAIADREHNIARAIVSRFLDEKHARARDARGAAQHE